MAPQSLHTPVFGVHILLRPQVSMSQYPLFWSVELLWTLTRHYLAYAVAYDVKTGVHINGQPIYVQGTCNHHDLGSLGAAFNTRAAERQLEMLQEMGTNALRTSHNPPAPEYLDMADHMGFMVQDEAYDAWNIGKRPNDFHRIFPEWHEADLRAFIRRDRNHPSIIAWSIDNELPEQGNSSGTATGRLLQDIAHQEDLTRLATTAMDSANATAGLADVINIVGLNSSTWSASITKVKVAEMRLPHGQASGLPSRIR